MRIIGLNNLSVEKNFFCLLSRFRIEAHFPLASPVIFRKRIIALNFTLPLYIGFKTRVLNLFHCYFFKITCSYIVVWSDLSRKWISCDCFGRSKCFTFWKVYWSGNQINMVSNFFWTMSGVFYRPEWKSSQNHKNISWTTNAITMKLYTVIVLSKTNILQEISRTEILHMLIYGPE